MIQKFRETIRSMFRSVSVVRRFFQRDFVIYKNGKTVERAKVVLFFSSDEVERCKLEEQIRNLERKIERIDRNLTPMENKYRKRHRELWNY